MTEYQPRSPERLVEILHSESTGPRSWQREAADEIERLSDSLSGAYFVQSQLNAEIERLRTPFRACDDEDWRFVFDSLSDGGRGRFWKSVLLEMKDALTASERGK